MVVVGETLGSWSAWYTGIRFRVSKYIDVLDVLSINPKIRNIPQSPMYIDPSLNFLVLEICMTPTEYRVS